jgi:hypothetical protein
MGIQTHILNRAPNNSSLLNNLINLVLFQGVWFVTVIGASQGSLWYGLAGITTFACIHHFVSHTAKADFQLATISILLGFAIETAVIQAGVLSYVHIISPSQIAPLWILLLWANLALTLNGCLRWLQGRYLLAALMGAMGGPLTYFGGMKLGAASTDLPMATALGVIAFIYAFTTPFLLVTAKWLSQQSVPYNEV